MSELVFFQHRSKNFNTDKPKYLVIFLHGYGANGANLIELAKEYENSMPNTHFIAPNAPQNWEGGFVDCYQWFSLASWGPERDVSKVVDGIKEASTKLGNFITEQLERFDLGPENLIILGFSQGAMMAMYQSLLMKEEVAGVIAHSGKLILPEFTGQKTNSKPKICLIHGKDDAVVDFGNFLEAEEILQEKEIEFESRAFDGLDHTIDIRGVKAGIDFVKRITKD